MKKEKNDSAKNPAKEVNQNNYDYLSIQLLLSGFGTALDEALYKMMQQGGTSIVSPVDLGSNVKEVELHFSESKKGYYFFNKFDLTAPDPNAPGQVFKQTFYQNDPRYYEGQNLNYTLKEAFNLLNGRPVLKTKLRKDGTAYKPWDQLNFNDRGKQGYAIVSYGERYGFDLDRELKNIVNLIAHKDQGALQTLKEGLERGNRQYAKEEVNGVSVVRYLEVKIKERQIDIYDKAGKLLGNSRELGIAQRKAQRKEKTEKQSGENKKEKHKRGQKMSAS